MPTIANADSPAGRTAEMVMGAFGLACALVIAWISADLLCDGALTRWLSAPVPAPAPGLRPVAADDRDEAGGAA